MKQHDTGLLDLAAFLASSLKYRHVRFKLDNQIIFFWFSFSYQNKI